MPFPQSCISISGDRNPHGKTRTREGPIAISSNLDNHNFHKIAPHPCAQLIHPSFLSFFKMKWALSILFVLPAISATKFTVAQNISTTAIIDFALVQGADSGAVTKFFGYSLCTGSVSSGLYLQRLLVSTDAIGPQSLCVACGHSCVFRSF